MEFSSCFPSSRIWFTVLRRCHESVSYTHLDVYKRQIYTHNFAGVEKNIVLGRNKLLSQYNDIINVNFNGISGIDGLFDRFSGSIKVPMYEWELLKDNRVFNKKS